MAQVTEDFARLVLAAPEGQHYPLTAHEEKQLAYSHLRRLTLERVLRAALLTYEQWEAEQAEEMKGQAFVIAEPGWVAEARAIIGEPPR